MYYSILHANTKINNINLTDNKQPPFFGIYKVKAEKHCYFSALYPDPGSNRDGLPHWCLRPARLPIPPSGLLRCKGTHFFYICKFFFKKSSIINSYLTKNKAPTCSYTLIIIILQNFITFASVYI